MANVAADTHIIIWYFETPQNLSKNAENALVNAVVNPQHKIYVSAISIVEMQYLVEKQKISADTLTDFIAELNLPDSIFEIAPVGREVAESVGKIPRSIVPDMPDRIIAATALHLNLPLITADRQIQKCKIKTIW